MCIPSMAGIVSEIFLICEFAWLEVADFLEEFSQWSLEEDLLNSTCSSCQVKQDRSAYWTPAMYFQDEAGNFHVVNQMGGMLV